MKSNEQSVPFAPSTAIAGAFTSAQLNEATIEDLTFKLDDGATTSLEVCSLYLERISALNSHGPGLNAVRMINPSWEVEAKLADERRATGEHGPLLGVPILVKDNIDIRGMPTTAGSIALAHSYPAATAPAILGLQRAGAVILGKTNLLEFAGGYSFAQPQGHSSLGGMTLNPYDVSIPYYGSSTGSASASAAGLAGASIGTDTGGSMMGPAAISNLVAVRPTMGLVSRTGTIPQQLTRDVLGPMARSVRDAAAILSAMATGPDDADPVTALSSGFGPIDIVATLSPNALKGVRIGVSTGSYQPMSTDQQRIWDRALAEIESAGAMLVPFDDELITKGTGDRILFAYEFANTIDAYFATLPPDAPIRSFADLRKFIATHPETTKYGSTTLDTAADVDLIADRARYEDARTAAYSATYGVVDRVRQSHDVGAIIFPGGSNVYTSSLSGLPAVTVPAGALEESGNPWSISFLGTRPFSDSTILNYAYAYEQATRHWYSPFTSNPGMYRCIPAVGGNRDGSSCPP